MTGIAIFITFLLAAPDCRTEPQPAAAADPCQRLSWQRAAVSSLRTPNQSARDAHCRRRRCLKSARACALTRQCSSTLRLPTVGPLVSVSSGSVTTSRPHTSRITARQRVQTGRRAAATANPVTRRRPGRLKVLVSADGDAGLAPLCVGCLR